MTLVSQRLAAWAAYAKTILETKLRGSKLHLPPTTFNILTHSLSPAHCRATISHGYVCVVSILLQAPPVSVPLTFLVPCTHVFWASASLPSSPGEHRPISFVAPACPVKYCLSQSFLCLWLRPGCMPAFRERKLTLPSSSPTFTHPNIG